MKRFKCFGRFVASSLRVHVFEVEERGDQFVTADGKVFERGYLHVNELLAANEAVEKEIRAMEAGSVSRREGGLKKVERIVNACMKENWVHES